MTPEDYLAEPSSTMTLESFWEWLTQHPNCVLRAGTPTTLVYDDDDYHWHFGQDSSGGLLTQVIRGKRLVGELLLTPEEIAFVQGAPGDQEGEFVFELFGRDEHGQGPVAFYVMTHGLETEDESNRGQVH